jgi:hypothetical protein
MTDIDHERQREEFRQKLVATGGISDRAAAFVAEQAAVVVVIEDRDIIGSGSGAKTIRIA